MNCKPGDLARWVKPGPLKDKLFFVLYKAPCGVYFKLPDGCSHAPVDDTHWVLESASTQPVKAILDGGETRETLFGAGPDFCLKPSRAPTYWTSAIA